MLPTKKRSRKQKVTSISNKVLFSKPVKKRLGAAGINTDITSKVINTFEKPAAFTKKNKKHVRNFILIFLLFCLLYFSRYVLIDSGKFNISKISLDGTGPYVSDKDLRFLLEQKYMSQNILLLNTSETRKGILTNFLGAKDVTVSKRFPDTLEVKVIERFPIAIIESTTLQQRFLLDEDGYVLGILGESYSGFPVIYFESDVQVGEFIDAEIVPLSARLLGEVEKKEVRMSSMSFSTNYVKFYNTDGVEILIGRDKDIEKSVKSIVEIVKTVSLEGKKLKKIDLRYDKVIVLYE